MGCASSSDAKADTSKAESRQQEALAVAGRLLRPSASPSLAQSDSTSLTVNTEMRAGISRVSVAAVPQHFPMHDAASGGDVEVLRDLLVPPG